MLKACFRGRSGNFISPYVIAIFCEILFMKFITKQSTGRKHFYSWGAEDRPENGRCQEAFHSDGPWLLYVQDPYPHSQQMSANKTFSDFTSLLVSLLKKAMYHSVLEVENHPSRTSLLFLIYDKQKWKGNEWKSARGQEVWNTKQAYWRVQKRDRYLKVICEYKVYFCNSTK